jgi:DNA-binding beta-propeller fold protein YncE
MMHHAGILRASAVVAFAAGVIAPARARAQQPQDVLYVCEQDEAKVAVIDMAARALVRTIDLTTMGFGPNAKPHYVQVEPDGSFWYVSLIGENRVLKLDRQDKIVGQFQMETPGLMQLVPQEDLLLVSRSMSAVNPPHSIGVLERSTMTGDELEVVFPRPHPMVAAANGFAYTGSLGVNQMAVVATNTQRVQLVNVDGPQHSLVQFALSPDRRTLVASTDLSGKLLVFDLANPAQPKLVRTIDVGKMAFHPSFTADGRALWVPVKSTNEILVLETVGWTVTDHIRDPSLKQPHQIIFSVDGSAAFVSNNNKADAAMTGMSGMASQAMPGPGALVVIDATTHKVIKAIPLGKNLTGMGARARQ